MKQSRFSAERYSAEFRMNRAASSQAFSFSSSTSSFFTSPRYAHFFYHRSSSPSENCEPSPSFSRSPDVRRVLAILRLLFEATTKWLARSPRSPLLIGAHPGRSGDSGDSGELVPSPSDRPLERAHTREMSECREPEAALGERTASRFQGYVFARSFFRSVVSLPPPLLSSFMMLPLLLLLLLLLLPPHVDVDSDGRQTISSFNDIVELLAAGSNIY